MRRLFGLATWTVLAACRTTTPSATLDAPATVAGGADCVCLQTANNGCAIYTADNELLHHWPSYDSSDGTCSNNTGCLRFATPAIQQRCSDVGARPGRGGGADVPTPNAGGGEPRGGSLSCSGRAMVRNNRTLSGSYTILFESSWSSAKVTLNGESYELASCFPTPHGFTCQEATEPAFVATTDMGNTGRRGVRVWVTQGGEQIQVGTFTSCL